MPSDYQLVIPSDRQLAIPSERQLAIPSDQQLAIRSDHQLAIRSDHQLAIPSDHQLTVPSDHQLTVPSAHQLTIPTDEQFVAPTDHERGARETSPPALDVSSPVKEELLLKSSPEDLVVPRGSFTDDSLEFEDDANDLVTSVTSDGYNDRCQPVTATQAASCTQIRQTAEGQLKAAEPCQMHLEEPRLSELQTEAQSVEQHSPAQQAPVYLQPPSSPHVAMNPPYAQHVPPADRLAFSHLPASATDGKSCDQIVAADPTLPHHRLIASGKEAVATSVLSPGAQDQMHRVTVSGGTPQSVLPAVDVELASSVDVQVEDELAAGSR